MKNKNTKSNNGIFILARFNSLCAETGKRIPKGTLCLYFPKAKKVFHLDSIEVKEFRERQFDEEQHELTYRNCEYYQF